jgi:predicted DNA-binding ArsR family transcriptional regulator
MAAVVISPAQLEWHLTGGIRGATNTNPFDSLGGQMAVKILDDKMDNLFDPVSAQEQKNGSIEHRWIVLQNKGTEPFKNPHFYFLPKDPNVDIEISRLSVSAPVTILPTEEDRPLVEEIGPEVDVPMPFEKSTEDYETTLSISPDILAGGKLYICVRRVIEEGSPSENRAFRLVCESRVLQATSTAASVGGELSGAGSTLAGR